MKREQIEKLSTRDIIACAMLNEKLACEDYNSIGKWMLRNKNPKVAKIFFESSKAEKGHFKKLQKALYRVYGIKIDDDCEIPWAADCGAGFGDDATGIPSPNMTAETAVAFLEKAEQGAVDFYRDAADLTERVDLKALFGSLEKEEGRHLTSVKKIARHSQIRELPAVEMASR